ncbi:MAG: 50S ribosomal protein L25 [Kiritimatiellia bacterium]
MANAIRLAAKPRTESGSGAAGRLRRAGSIPAAVGNMNGGTTLIQIDTHDFTLMLRHHQADQLLVTLVMDGKDLPAIMREVQYDVLSGVPTHADFTEVDINKPIRVECAIHLVGEPDGVKNGGGVLDQLLRHIHVECLPGDIVEHFDVDVSALKLNEALEVKDLDFGAKYRIATLATTPVATVVKADEEIVVDTPAETAEAASPEVIAKGKKEEGAAPAADAKK